MEGKERRKGGEGACRTNDKVVPALLIVGVLNLHVTNVITHSAERVHSAVTRDRQREREGGRESCAVARRTRQQRQQLDELRSFRDSFTTHQQPPHLVASRRHRHCSAPWPRPDGHLLFAGWCRLGPAPGDTACAGLGTSTWPYIAIVISSRVFVHTCFLPISAPRDATRLAFYGHPAALEKELGSGGGLCRLALVRWA